MKKKNIKTQKTQRVQKAILILSCSYLMFKIFSPLITEKTNVCQFSSKQSEQEEQNEQINYSKLYDEEYKRHFLCGLVEKPYIFSVNSDILSNYNADKNGYGIDINDDFIIEDVEEDREAIEEDAVIDVVEDEVIDISINNNNNDKDDTNSNNNDIQHSNYIDKPAPKNNSFKSYMGKDAITDKSSEQYALISKAIIDPATSIMMIDNRYCIALGSYYTHQKGQYVDLIMEDGNIIPCIVGDCKANRDTDLYNQQHTADGSVVEFIVNENYNDGITITQVMNKVVGVNTGNVGDILSGCKGEISYIRIY